MLPRAIKHQLTCPFELTSGSFLIGRRRILVIHFLIGRRRILVIPEKGSVSKVIHLELHYSKVVARPCKPKMTWRTCARDDPIQMEPSRTDLV